MVLSTLDSEARSRFWAKAAKSAGCWVWTGGLLKGYGSFSLNDKTYSAHRMAWRLTYGRIPRGAWVLHRCDVPACIRPDHLYLGDAKQNFADMIARGHWQCPPPFRLCGEAHPMAKLSWSDVYQIRSRAQAGESKRSLAFAFGVSRPAIQKLVAGRAWRV